MSYAKSADKPKKIYESVELFLRNLKITIWYFLIFSKSFLAGVHLWAICVSGTRKCSLLKNGCTNLLQFFRNRLSSKYCFEKRITEQENISLARDISVGYCYHNMLYIEEFIC